MANKKKTRPIFIIGVLATLSFSILLISSLTKNKVPDGKEKSNKTQIIKTPNLPIPRKISNTPKTLHFEHTRSRLSEDCYSTLKDNPELAKPEHIQEIATALIDIEKDIKKAKNKENLTQSYFELQNMYYKGVKQLRGVKAPSKEAQEKLEDYKERIRNIDDPEERRKVKLEILMNN